MRNYHGDDPESRINTGPILHHIDLYYLYLKKPILKRHCSIGLFQTHRRHSTNEQPVSSNSNREAYSRTKKEGASDPS